MLRPLSGNLSFIKIVALILIAVVAGSGTAFSSNITVDELSEDRKAENSSGSTSRQDKSWQVFAAAYGWLSDVNGISYDAGNKSEIDIPFSDIIENTQSGLMLYAEGRWRKWFASFDGTWVKLGAEETGQLLDIDVDLEKRIFDMRIGRQIYGRILDEPSSNVDEGWERTAAVDIFFGARYFYTKPTVILSSKLLNSMERFSTVDERWDPFIGFRAGYDFTRRWSAIIRTDFGGFGIGNAANFSWQVEGTIGFRMTRHLSLLVGYRALSFDTVEGNGPNRSGIYLTQHGPIIGLGVNF